MAQIQLLGDQYTTLSPAFSAQTCINFYPELDNPHYHHYLEDDRKTKYSGYLVNTPGCSQFINLNGSAKSVRGLYEYNNILYSVADNFVYSTIYSPNNQYITTQIGTLLTVSGQVRMTNNFSQIAFFDGTHGYVYNLLTGVFSQITDPNFNGAQFGSYTDGYGVITNPGTSNWQLSTLSDFTSWPASTSSSISSFTDILVGQAIIQREIYLFGLYHCEMWDNLGLIPFPFQQRAGILVETGCAAPYTIMHANNTLYWLTRDRSGRCYLASFNGYSPSNVTTDPIVAEFTGYTKVDDAFAYVYQDAGHLFYVITFPTQNTTFVYDISSQMWHKRSSQVGQPLNQSQNPVTGRHLSNCYAFFNGKHIIGDYQSGNLYEMSRNYFTDNGTPIIRERTVTHLTNDLKQSRISMIKLECQMGVGTTTGAGNDTAQSNPQIGLEISKDYGITWGRQRLRNLGPQGKEQPSYARWNANGSSRNWTFRFRTADPVPVRLIGLNIDSIPGNN